MVMNRRGFSEQTWLTFSYSPVRNEHGAVAGMFCAVAETTGGRRARIVLTIGRDFVTQSAVIS